MLFLAFLFAGLHNFAFAGVELQVVETSPAGQNIELGLNEKFSLKIAYDTDEPIDVWARPFFQGSQVDAMSNASVKRQGQGFALGWFSFTEPAEVDEVRLIIARRGSNDGEQMLSYPVSIQAGGDSAGPAEASWVSALTDQETVLRREAADNYAHENPIGAKDIAFTSAFMLAVLGLLTGGIVAPVMAFFRWTGRWRMAAAAPALLLAVVIVKIIIDTSVNPKSHNLWPFEILTFSGVSLVAIAVMALARLIMTKVAGSQIG